MNIHIKRLNKEAKYPVYSTDGSGCFDLYSTTDANIELDWPIEIGTGLAFEIPEGHVMLLFSRSGHGFKHSIRLSNCVGVIDSDYRGEVKAKLCKDSPFGRNHIKKGERFVQGMIIPVPRVEFVEAENLSTTERGEGGFGSTNV